MIRRIFSLAFILLGISCQAVNYVPIYVPVSGGLTPGPTPDWLWLKLSSDITDYSPNAFSFTAANTLAFTANGMTFNGTSQFLNGGNILSVGMSNFSFTCWIKTTFSTSPSSAAAFATKTCACGQNGRYLFCQTSGSLGAIIIPDAEYDTLTSETSYIDGNSHFICITVSRGGGAAGLTALYVDNVLKTSTSTAASPSNPLSTSDVFLVGAFGDSSGGAAGAAGFFNGSMRDVGMYGHILTSTEQSNLFNSGPRP